MDLSRLLQTLDNLPAIRGLVPPDCWIAQFLNLARSFVLVAKSYWIFLCVAMILELSILTLIALSNMGAEPPRRPS